jgi:hypothetical protein
MALGVIVLAVFGSRLSVSYRTPLSGCARDNGTGGGSGLFRWAGRVGIPLQLIEVPLAEVPGALHEASGNCVVTMGNDAWSPTAEELEPASWQAVSAWVARGNSLIIVTAAPRSLPRAVRKELIPATVIELAAQSASSIGEETVDNRPETALASVTGGGALSVASKGPRWKFSAAIKAAPAASTKGSPPPAQEAEPAQSQQAGDERGGVLFRFPIGRGAVYVLLDEFAWTNAGLDGGENAAVLAEILDREVRGGVLALDEYRHGHGRTESFLAYLLTLPGASAFMGLAAIWGFLNVYGCNVRLKPVEPYVERQRRTSQEYIDAVAQLYGRARAAPLIVEAVARRLRQLTRSAAENPPAAVALLQSADSYVRAQERPAAPGHAIALVREIIQLRKRIYGSRTAS